LNRKQRGQAGTAARFLPPPRLRPALWILAAALLAACAPIRRPLPAEKISALVRLSPHQYPDFCDRFSYDNLPQAVAKSLDYLNQKPPHTVFQFGEDHYSVRHLIRSLTGFRDFITTRPSCRQLQAFIEKNYLVYRAAGSPDGGEVLFTGYYEPFLNGSLTRTARYRYPVYARPDNLVSIDLSLFSDEFKGKRIIGRYAGRTVVPYDDRRQIEENPDFARQARPLAWVDNRIDLFFLQIQGSGKIYLDNGKIINVHYDTGNGQPYRSIGKLLISQQKIDPTDMSMQSIRHYLKAHPGQIPAILQHNPSYVFFKLEDKGPIGSLGVELTPARSMATDRTLFPPAAIGFVQTQIPLIDGDCQIRDWMNFSGFVLNQDTGGAIKGAGRVDLFWGNGPYAETAAGYMQHTGQLYFIVLKPDAL
jgi:membrane-bound lytic murein transglycosylase A